VLVVLSLKGIPCCRRIQANIDGLFAMLLWSVLKRLGDLDTKKEGSGGAVETW
jgi:hypothetical protein